MKRHNMFVERSLSGVLFFFRETVLSDEYAARKGFLQLLDPRVKLLTLAGLIFVAMFIRDFRFLLAMYAFCVALAAASRLGILFFLKRTWVFIPLFSLCIAVPSLFHPFTPGDPVAVFSAAGMKLAVTRQGLSAAVIFVSRVLVSVSLSVLLMITTRSSELFAALRCFGIPQVFVMTLGMCHRYIFLLVGIVQDMFLGIKSRTGGTISCRRGRNIVSWNIAVLWDKSMRMNEDVYNAMVSRGYDGEPRAPRRLRVRPVDWGWLCVIVLLSAALIYFSAL